MEGSARRNGEFDLGFDFHLGPSPIDDYLINEFDDRLRYRNHVKLWNQKMLCLI